MYWTGVPGNINGKWSASVLNYAKLTHLFNIHNVPLLKIMVNLQPNE